MSIGPDDDEIKEARRQAAIALASAGLAEGRAAFSRRCEAYWLERAHRLESDREREADLNTRAREMVRQWEELRQAYAKALPGLDRVPEDQAYLKARRLWGDYGRALEEKWELARTIRENPKEFGLTDYAPLAHLLRSGQPARMLDRMLELIEERERLVRREAAGTDTAARERPALHHQTGLSRE